MDEKECKDFTVFNMADKYETIAFRGTYSDAVTHAMRKSKEEKKPYTVFHIEGGVTKSVGVATDGVFEPKKEGGS